MWIFGFTCLVFKTTYIDAENPLREGAFFFTRRMLFLRWIRGNTRDKAKGLYISSERHTGGGRDALALEIEGWTRGNSLQLVNDK